MTDALPAYVNPPVYEVALAVQFATNQPLIAADLAALHSAVAAEYPDVRDKPTLPPMFVGSPTPVEIEFPPTPTPRMWFCSADDSNLVQLQFDRVVVNWRRRQSDENYPRYDTIRPRLVQIWDELVKYQARAESGTPRPNVVEVTYVNPIEPVSGIWQDLTDIDKVIEPWTGALSADPPAHLRSVGMRLEFDLPDVNGGLVVSVDPVTNVESDTEAIMLTLTARAALPKETFDCALELLDVGHEAIVRAFTALTTVQMHEYWGKEV